MLLKAVFPGTYLQGAQALGQLPEQLALLGTRALVVSGKTAAQRYVAGLTFPHTPATFGGECSEPEIARLTELGAGCDVVVGMGGGKVIDTAKAVGHALGARTAIVPTIASTDAPTSAVAVIYTPEGAFLRYLFLPRNPDLVLVDTQVIAEAPVRFLVAGLGDALSTWFEAESCRRSRAPNQCGGRGTAAAFSLARLCYDTILEYGVTACRACEARVVTPALEHVVEANTLLSGLGFESAGLGAAHSIHNGLTRLAATHHYYHGEKVAFGVLSSLFLTDHSTRQINEVYAFCAAVGLPIRLADLGVLRPSDEDLRMVAEGACAAGETIHHEAGGYGPAEVMAAIQAADAYGRALKG